jgi:hypothetical protein
MTFSRNSIFAVSALAAALVFMFSGATVKDAGQGNAHFAQRIAEQVSPAAEQAASTLDAPIARVVVTGRRMTDAEKAAFDRDQA